MIYEYIGSLIFYALVALLVWKIALSKKSKAKQWVRIVVLLVFVLLIVGRVSAIDIPKDGIPITFDTPETKSLSEQSPPTEEELLTLVNEERAKVGVAALTIDSRLSISAQYKAEDMTNRSYFSHYDPADPTKVNGVQYGYNLTRGSDGLSSCRAISENIHDSGKHIYTGVASATSQEALQGWMGSKPHREAILDAKYTTTGFGISGSKVVQHFCQPK